MPLAPSPAPRPPAASLARAARSARRGAGIVARAGTPLRRLLARPFALLLACGIPALAQPAPEPHPPWLTPPAGAAETPPAPWRVVGLPQQHKPFTRFSAVTLDGQRVLRVEALSSYGNLVHGLPGMAELRDPPHRLSWRWRLDLALPAADLHHKDGDDSPVKVCALFDLPTPALPFLERQLLRLARLQAGEDLPSASVCYVWDSRLAAGTVLDNAFTRRVRTIVLRGPDAALQHWVGEQRDLAADFLQLFGDESRTVPPLIGVAIGADADNTHGHSLAHVGAISLD